MIKVLVVDDSAVVRQVFSAELSRYPDITIVGTAPDPYIARDMIVSLEPDVITLDVEMPRMDGLTFLRKLMVHRPLPVIIVSSLTPKGGEMALEALSLGAFDVMCKPGAAHVVGDIIPQLASQIRAAAGIDPQRFAFVNKMHDVTPARLSLTKTTNRIIAIGASTGGTVAVEDVLRKMPANAPGIVVVQHMPAGFTASFAKRLDGVSALEVREARSGDSIVPGVVLIAPGGYHLVVKRSGARYIVEIEKGLPVFHQMPSVEVLFNSVAQYVGRNAVAAILTGMGSDGARGLLAIRQAGGRTVAQDEKSSVVWGMPGAAVKIDAAEDVLPLQDIAQKLLSRCSET